MGLCSLQCPNRYKLLLKVIHLNISSALLTCYYTLAFLGMLAQWLCMAFTIFTCIQKIIPRNFFNYWSVTVAKYVEIKCKCMLK